MKIRKWRRVTHEETGISCEVGRLSYLEKPRLAIMIAEVFGSIASLRGEDGEVKAGVTAAQMSEALRQAFDSIDAEFLEGLFERRVRDVQNLETEDGAVETGLGLLELADDDILLWVLRSLSSASSLTDEEGKGSGSPSTSPPGETDASSSPAPSTGDGAGTAPSTAAQPPTSSASSSQEA